jgi:hypothetical protein
MACSAKLSQQLAWPPTNMPALPTAVLHNKKVKVLIQSSLLTLPVGWASMSAWRLPGHQLCSAAASLSAMPSACLSSSINNLLASQCGQGLQGLHQCLHADAPIVG